MVEQHVEKTGVTQVNPGDLITADWMNGLLIRLSNLDDLVQALAKAISGLGEKPTGQLYVTLKKSPAAEVLEEGHSYTFIFNLKAAVRVDETYVLEAKIQAEENQSAWKVSAVSQIFLPAAANLMVGSNKEVSVTVSIPDGTTQSSAVLTLSVHALRNEGGLRDEESVDLIVGGEPPPAQNIWIDPEPVQKAGITYVAETKSVTLNQNNVNITYNAHFTFPDTYSVSVAIESSTDGWKAYLLSSQNPPIAQPGGGCDIKVNVQGHSGLAQATLKITIAPTTLDIEPYVFAQPFNMS